MSETQRRQPAHDNTLRSLSLFKVLQKEGVVIQTPYAALRAQLDDERYDAVRARI